jgi:hypothetical protein
VNIPAFLFVGGLTHKGTFEMKNGKFIVLGMLVVLMVFGSFLLGCDNGTGGTGGTETGGWAVTITNNYAQPITKVELSAADCIINDLTVLSEETNFINQLARSYEYTTPIASGASKTFSIKLDANKEQCTIGIFITAEGVDDYWDRTTSAIFTNFAHNYKVKLSSDGVLDGTFK